MAPSGLDFTGWIAGTQENSAGAPSSTREGAYAPRKHAQSPSLSYADRLFHRQRRRTVFHPAHPSRNHAHDGFKIEHVKYDIRPGRIGRESSRWQYRKGRPVKLSKGGKVVFDHSTR
ncbi:MAG: hypothetical protein ACI9VS_002432 [Candidatus Binatia bacterium]|jgi:hypothetical protein